MRIKRQEKTSYIGSFGITYSRKHLHINEKTTFVFNIEDGRFVEKQIRKKECPCPCTQAYNITK